MNLREAIEAIQKRFQEDYGVTVNVDIYAHTSNNEHLNSELAEHICKDVAAKLKAEPARETAENVHWWEVESRNFNTRIVTFFEDAHVEALKEIKEILA